jgi:hypothetical protein
MSKLRLDFEELTVDSFQTSTEQSFAGSVRARSEDDGLGEMEVVGEVKDICYISRNNSTCAASCGDTCYASCVSLCSCPTRACDGCA